MDLFVTNFQGEHNALYQQYDQSAFNESNANKHVLATRVDAFLCPDEPNVNLSRPDSGPGSSFQFMPGSYRAMTGRGEPRFGNWWGNNFSWRRSLPRQYRGPIHVVGSRGPAYAKQPLKQVRLKQIQDGTSKTIAFGERSLEQPDRERRRTLWAYSYGSYNKSAAYHQPRIFMRNYRACLATGGIGGSLPCKHGWSSYHRTVNFAYCDGSVRQIDTTDLDLKLFVAMSTIDGGMYDGRK